MALSFTGKQEERALVAEGEYEVTLKTEWGYTKSKDPYIKLIYTIRKDVEQNEQGNIIYDGIYKSKTTGEFSKKKIDSILAGIPNPKLDFENYDELIQYLNNVNMIVEVVIEKADGVNLQNDRNSIKFWSNKPTAVGETFIKQEPVEDNSIKPEELPF